MLNYLFNASECISRKTAANIQQFEIESKMLGVFE